MTNPQLLKQSIVLKTHIENPCYELSFSRCSYGSALDGYIEIYVRSDATYRDLLAMHERFGVPISELLEFREHHALPPAATH